MKSVVQLGESLGMVETTKGPCEMCAEGSATLDETGSVIVVRLAVSLRPSSLHHRHRRMHADWLPGPTTVSRHMKNDDARRLAREIFTNWIHDLQKKLPPSHGEEDQAESTTQTPDTTWQEKTDPHTGPHRSR